MGVMAGYKQTEVGVIPVDWEFRSLDSLGKRARPAIKAGPFGSSLTKDTYVGEGYKVYGQEQVIRSDYLFGDYFISKARFNALKSCAVEPGDILLSLVGTAGRVLVIPQGAPEGVINPRLIRFSFDRDLVSPRFFQALLETDAYQAILARSAQGGTMGGLNAGLIRPLCIPLPPVAEQEAIAEAFSDTDAFIESLEQLLAKKRHIKQGAMQELLRPKDGWIQKTLGESCEIVTKGTTPTSIGRDFASSGINFLKAESISESGKPIAEKMAFIDEVTHKLLKRSQLEDADLLVSIAGVLGRVGIVEKDVLPANTNQALAIIRLGKKSDFERDYLFYYLRSPMLEKQIGDINVQAAQANISLQNVRDFQINIPPSKEEQTAIATILSDMDTELAALESKLIKYRQIKQGMMHQLLTGKIRLV